MSPVGNNTLEFQNEQFVVDISFGTGRTDFPTQAVLDEIVKTFKWTPFINSISPKFGPVGTKVEVFGSGFQKNTTVYFAKPEETPWEMIDVGAYNEGSLVSFVIPKELNHAGSGGGSISPYTASTSPGLYKVVIDNVRVLSNAVEFEVTK